MKKFSVLGFGLAMLVATSAQAGGAKFNISATWVRDNSLYPASAGKGTDKILFINLSTATTICGTSQTQIIFSQSSTAQFDNYVRFANSALLSGRQMYLETYQTSVNAPCYLVAIGLS